MIGEANILSTSLWSADLFSKEFQSEFLKPCSTDELGVSLDTEFKRSKPNVQHFGSSCSQSSASSECSEDLYTENNNAHGDHDYFNPTFMNLLDDNIITEPISLYELSLGAEEDFENCDNAPSTSNAGTTVNGASNSSNFSVPSRQKKCKYSDNLSNAKSWSSMSHLEQIETVDTLSQIISNQMGLREQLDVIRIIDPTAAISSTDNEFIIDIATFTSKKLQAIRDYVRNVQGNIDCKKCSASSACESGDFNEDSSCKLEGKQHKREVKGKRSQQKEQKAIKQRQKKEHRQLMKEKRSGLFLKEEVLSLSTNVQLGDDSMDIDILD